MGKTSTKLGLMCLAQGHNSVMPVRLVPAALRSRVKHSTTEQLRSHILGGGGEGLPYIIWLEWGFIGPHIQISESQLRFKVNHKNGSP